MGIAVRKTFEEHMADAPPLGTTQRKVWQAGAAAEAAARLEGVDDGNREVVETVDSMRQNGYTGAGMVEFLTAVFGPGLPARTRRRLAWKLVRGYRTRRWYVEPIMSRSDFGLGVRWERDDTGLHIYVTVLVLVVHARKARR